MTRIGMNPARGRVSDYHPPRVTIAVLVYIPYLAGYFQHRLDVLKLCLGSIIKHTEKPYDLFVFDNGSCEEVKTYLRSLLDAGTIQYLLVASDNIGKIGALRIMFEAIPSEVIAYTDDDIFFYPGWLPAHLELLDKFPGVGMVSGCAIRTLFDHGISSNLKMAEQDPEVSLVRGQNIPDKWEVEWADSYGRDPVKHLENIQNMEDFLIERRGVRAFAAANHNQFVTPKTVINQFIPSDWSGRLMGQMHELDIEVDAGGYLRLSTLERTTKHMGNVVGPAMMEEATQLGLSLEDISTSSIEVRPRNFGAYVLRVRPIYRILLAIYNRLFWFLSQQSGGWLKQNGINRE